MVTGGAGYIGSHTCKQLFRAGFEPVTYDDLSRGHAFLVRHGPVIEGRLHDRMVLRAVLREVRPLACMHFAAFAYVAESVSNPALYYDNNVVGSLILFEELIAAKVTYLVFSSTCAIYGQAKTVPIREDAPMRPLSAYGRSKLIVENMLADFDDAYGLRSVSLRYFNAAGADPDGELGEVHSPEPHLLPRALMAAAGVIPALQVNGDDFSTVDGTAVRDYTHVCDLADAHVLALRHLLDGGTSDRFNLGLGQGHSVREVIQAVHRVTGREVPVVIGSRRQGDPAEVVADASKSERVLGFRPRYTGMEEMVAHAWRWFSEHGFAEGA